MAKLQIESASFEPKVNHKYLLFWTVSGVLLLQMQCGFVIGENTRVGFVLSKKLDWGENFILYNTALSVIGLAGLGLGPYIGGSIVHKLGLRNLLIIS